MATTATGAETIEWDLSDLYLATDDPRLESDLDEALSAAKAFREHYHGRLAELSAADLHEATAELERIKSIVSRADAFARLRFAADTSDEARGALAQRVRERGVAVETEVLFFDLEWASLEDDRAEALLADDALEHYRNVLRAQRRFRPHLLSEPEERLDAEKSLTGTNAWTRLFDELLSDVRVPLDDAELSLDEALSRLSQLSDHEDRRRTAEAVTEALRPGVRTRAFILNTILNERAIEDRLRRYPTWISARNLANQIPDDAVESLVEAIRSRYDIPHRYYALKARLLGLPRLADYDRFAPLEQTPTTIEWDEARTIVTEAFASFSPLAGDVAERFFSGNWIDAAGRPGKTTGAFCATLVPGVHPYVLLTYAGERRSVLTLAHELGHGLHGVLASPLGLLNARTPLTLAETASVLGETLTFRSLLEREDDPRARLDLLTGQIEDALATVFRQIAMNRFEHAIHTHRRSEGELPVERLCELWANEQEQVLGEAVEVTEGYRSWWSYIPHFVDVPGYVYAYAFGFLFSLAIYRRYVEEGDALVEPILDLLRAGGSAPPAELAARLGFDLDDPGFWAAGLDAISGLVDEAEQVAAQAGVG
ncbi:MAG: M3 family oligoendopeptidase [Actinomycetota bacterium]|nr:M3 family oligoendopeptidase [Actinomycetota bacterium]